MSDDEFDLIFDLGVNFVRILAELFGREGFEIVSEPDRQKPHLVIRKNGVRTLVEVRVHRSAGIVWHNIADAYYRLHVRAKMESAENAILFVTRRSPRLPKTPAHISVWDVAAVTRRLEKHPDLMPRFLELMQALQVGAEEGPRLDPTEIELEIETDMDRDRGPPAGADIIAGLGRLKPGAADATVFEDLCERALRLMFGSEFVGWTRQNDVDDGFHRIDLIARLVPNRNPFWSTLATDFRTRYVVFEFKNYTEAIGQEQIYTTEKYLFTAALRSVALIVARNGAAGSARKACRGALREQGKVILWISSDELCTMLATMDDGGDPTDMLYGKLDELLMTVAR